MQRNDLNGFEQSISTFALYSQDGLEKIKNIESFQGDGNLKYGAQIMLNFYKQEAEKDFPAMSNFYIKKDDFEKIQKTFESISEGKRTQKDIDQYNAAVKELNKAAVLANKISESSNNARKNYLDKWNKIVENFFDAHSN